MGFAQPSIGLSTQAGNATSAFHRQTPNCRRARTQCDPVAPILDPKEQDVHLQHWYASGKYETLRSSDGQKKIGFGGDKDTIPVTIKEGVFKRVKFKVAGQAAKIWDMKIHFGNGEVQDVQLRKEFKPNSWTRVIDLPGSARVIKKVTLLYKSRLRAPLKRGKATLQLYGARVEGSDEAVKKPVAKPAPATPMGKWESLGSRKVAWTVDRDTIPVTIAEGRFRKLRMSVTGNKIHLMKLKVVYGNGEETELTVNKLVAAGAKSPALDLPGNKRIVKKVVFWYKIPGRRRLRRIQPRATVTLWGMK